MKIPSPPNCICSFYEYVVNRRKTKTRKAYSQVLTKRNFRVGCPTHDKSLLCNNAQVN